MFNGGGNMAGMMKKVQKMQADMKKMQDELRKKTVEVSSGGGAVKVVMDGEKQVQSLFIAPAAVDPEDIEMLQDLISAAFNEATKKVDDMMAQEMGKLTSEGEDRLLFRLLQPHGQRPVRHLHGGKTRPHDDLCRRAATGCCGDGAHERL